MHTLKAPLIHTTFRLILIRVQRDYSDSKALSHNIDAFSLLELRLFC